MRFHDFLHDRETQAGPVVFGSFAAPKTRPSAHRRAPLGKPGVTQSGMSGAKKNAPALLKVARA
jgi:hypothetical protein